MKKTNEKLAISEKKLLENKNWLTQQLDGQKKKLNGIIEECEELQDQAHALKKEKADLQMKLKNSEPSGSNVSDFEKERLIKSVADLQHKL